MFSLPLSLVIEGLVAALLLVTIGYCMVLNTRLKRLRADEAGLRATIAELLTATEIAERAIHGLRSTSAECDQTLGQRLKEAKNVSDALSSGTTGAHDVLARLGKLAALGASGSAEGQSKGEVVAAARAPRTAASRAAGESRRPAPATRGSIDTLHHSPFDPQAVPQDTHGDLTRGQHAYRQQRQAPHTHGQRLGDAAQRLQARLQRVADHAQMS